MNNNIFNIINMLVVTKGFIIICITYIFINFIILVLKSKQYDVRYI